MVAIMEFIRLDAHVRVPVRGRYTYYPSAADVRKGSMVNGGGRFFQLLAEIEITGDAQGVICSQRSRCGGYSLFLQDGKLVFAHDVTGAPPVKPLHCDTPDYGKHIVGVEFTKREGSPGTVGAVMLSVDGRPMAAAPVRAMPARLASCGEGLWIGRDGSDVVHGEYESSFPLAGARVIEVVFDLCEEAVIGGEQDRTPAPARD
jgi:hypothetical protein